MVLFYEMRARVEAMPRFRVELSGLDLYNPGDFPWMKGEEMRELLRIPFERRDKSIFDPTLLNDVRQTFLRNPWVAGVDMVQRRYPNTVTFKVRLRRPVAYVSNAQRFYLADGECIRLPGVYACPPAELALPVVTGAVLQEPAPPVGLKYRSAAVTEALNLIAILEQHRGLLESHGERVEEIDVRNVGSTQGSEVNFRLSSGIVFEWGRTPTSRNLQTLSTERKIENLKRALESRPADGRPGIVPLWSYRFGGFGAQ